MTSCRVLLINGVLQSCEVPPISAFLGNHYGAYTTTRTHEYASSLLFWERHLSRLADSARIIAESRPESFLTSKKSRVLSTSSFESVITPLVNDSLPNGLPIALKERSGNEELAITTLVCGISDEEEEEEVSRVFDVYVHVGSYVPMLFGSRENGARLAIVGRGRDVARAKFTEWVRRRKGLENLRPPLATELLLSNDGDQILEGSVTNFFVVCRREMNAALDGYPYDPKDGCMYEVQTAPVSDGVLPGVIRQVVIEACKSRGIPVQEVAPLWSNQEHWEEAFVTSSLRLVQHVEMIQAPSSWEQLESKTWKEVSWEEKQFEGPGRITAEINRVIVEKADVERYPTSNFL